jgi:hypothetical protein
MMIGFSVEWNWVRAAGAGTSVGFVDDESDSEAEEEGRTMHEKHVENSVPVAAA